MPISVKYTKHDSEKNLKHLEDLKEKSLLLDLNRFGEMGVEYLRAASPVRTGLMSNSWYYEVVKNNNKTALIWYNSDIEDGYNVAIIVDQGHATKGGGWIQGKNFISKAMEPVFEALDNYLKKEVLGS
jgi:hypothetical protein